MNVKVSVIVPVYNVEKFLEKTIKSILNQTFKEFELILINDGSTDKSGEICNDYSKLDSRVIVKHIQNQGVSAARNLGLDIAKGDYIGFVDSDDIIEMQTLEILYNEIKFENCDMVKCDFNEIKCTSDEYIKYESKYIKNYEVKTISNKKDIFYAFLKNELGVSCWGKLFKKELFKNKRFKNIIVNEDLDLLLKLMPNLNKVKIIDYPCYKYVRRDNSTTTSFFSEEKIQTINVHKDIVEFCKLYYPEYKNLAEKKYYGAIMLVLHSICYKSNNNDIVLQNKYNQIIIKLRKNLKSIIFNTELNKKEKIILLVMCIGKNIYIKFINILNYNIN